MQSEGKEDLGESLWSWQTLSMAGGRTVLDRDQERQLWRWITRGDQDRDSLLRARESEFQPVFTGVVTDEGANQVPVISRLLRDGKGRWSPFG